MERNVQFGHVNIYHLENKLHDVCTLLQQHDIHILGITETRLSGYKHSTESISLPNYTFYRRDAVFPGHTGIGAYIHT